MAEDQPSLYVDSDWKKQAQEEKRKLAEQSKARQADSIAPAVTSSASAATGPAASTRRTGRQVPAPGFGSLVQSVMTQILYYLGELPTAGQSAMDLDLAKHHLDTLTMLEEKTKNNLNLEEQGLMDAALYETRTRFISVASQLLGP